MPGTTKTWQEGFPDLATETKRKLHFGDGTRTRYKSFPPLELPDEHRRAGPILVNRIDQVDYGKNMVLHLGNII